MPGMTGMALLRLMKDIREDLPVIVMSGYLGDTLVHRARAEGASQVLAKPVARAELAAALSSVFPGAARRTAGRRDGRQ